MFNGANRCVCVCVLCTKTSVCVFASSGTLDCVGSHIRTLSQIIRPLFMIKTIFNCLILPCK